MNIPITENLKKALDSAKKAALKFSNAVIGTEHVLYGLLMTDGCGASSLLKQKNVTAEQFEEVFRQSSHFAQSGVELSDRVSQTLLSAHKVSLSLGEQLVGTEHMLYCFLSDSTSLGCHILTAHDVNLDLLKSEVADILRKNKAQLDTAGGAGVGGGLPAQLADLGLDLTKKAAEHKIDPIIGREEEIERIIQILCRKTKNNPVLIGEPGVGKSAVVEGLAKAIVEGDVPELLRGKIVFSLDIASLVAGTKYRGALEEKLKSAIDLIMRQGNIIVFIDELHTLAQAGSKEGEVTPSDILKPYLARGELQTIGATTTDEYKKYIEKDKALERRFQPVTVAPPTVEQTIEILRGLKEHYEAFHKIKIKDEALEAAAKLSDRYIMDRYLPDKAIDLIDEAMSRAKVSTNTIPPDLKREEAELIQLEQQKIEAMRHNNFRRVDELNMQLTTQKSKIEQLKIDWSRNNEREGREIGEEEIAHIVAKWTKIPVTKLTETEVQRLAGLEEILHKRVIGQDAAVSAVAKAIRRARAGLKDPNRPVGSFLFLGPTGVGKTELTKALSEAMFDDENQIIRLDMSEYMESHSVSKLIGSPPGYVGYDEGGQLTEQVRRKPYSVVLFDEIEKAHPDINNALLQILDDGRLTDAQGRVVSFKNTIIIMTSNVGAANVKKAPRSLGFSVAGGDTSEEDDRAAQVMMDALKRHFKPEFINRIDVISIFKHLSRENIAKIAVLLLAKSEKNLKERGIKLQISERAMDFIIEKGYDSEYGARPLRRVIQQNIEDNIAEGILSGRIKNFDTVQIDSLDGNITVNVK